jgi:hypothetical protein
VLLASGGKDIIKKSSARKGRYLLNIAAALRPTAAGKMVGREDIFLMASIEHKSLLVCIAPLLLLLLLLLLL